MLITCLINVLAMTKTFTFSGDVVDIKTSTQHFHYVSSDSIDNYWEVVENGKSVTFYPECEIDQA